MLFKGAGLRTLRWLSWLLLAWVFLRGIVSFLPTTASSAPSDPLHVGLTEPAGLRVFPARFAEEYLTLSSSESTEDYTQRLRPFLAQEATLGSAVSTTAVNQRVQSLWVYAVQEVSPTRWLVTVVAELERSQPGTGGIEQPLPPATIHLAIPMAHTSTGGWLVYDYPTLLPPPPVGEFTEPLHFGQEIADEGGQINALLTRFFQAYFTGNNADLTYYLTPNANVRAFRSPWTFDSVSNVILSKTESSLYALVEVLLVDPVTGARYTSRYTTSLTELEGRWYVNDILQKGE